MQVFDKVVEQVQSVGLPGATTQAHRSTVI